MGIAPITHTICRCFFLLSKSTAFYKPNRQNHVTMLNVQNHILFQRIHQNKFRYVNIILRNFISDNRKYI